MRQTITESKLIVVTRYSGGDFLGRVRQLITERRTGEISLHLSQGAVQAVEFRETKRKPVDVFAVLENNP